MSERDPDAVDAMRAVQDNLRKRIRTMLVGKVVSFDPTGPSASVQPQVNDVGHAGDEVSAPQLPDLPVMYPGGGGWEFSWALQAGDIVSVLCFDRSLDQWWASGLKGAPNDLRKHDIRDAVCVPMGPWRPGKFGSAHATNLRISGPGGMAFEVTPAGTIEFAGGGAAVARVGDAVSPTALMSTWMGQVAGFINGVAPGTVAPPAPVTFGSISQGSPKVSSG